MASQGGFIILQAFMGALELPVVLKMQTFWLWCLVAFGLVLVPMLGKLQMHWYRGGWAFHWAWQEFVWWIAGVPWFYWWWLCGSLFKIGKKRPLAPGYQGPHLSKLIPLTSFAETLLTVSISDMIAICGALSVSKGLKTLEKTENAQFVFVDTGFSDNIQEG